MTTTAEIVERLRQQHLHHCFQIDREAADHIESLARERDRAVAALRLSQSVLAQFREPDMKVSAANIFAQICEAETKCHRVLDQIDAETEG